MQVTLNSLEAVRPTEAEGLRNVTKVKPFRPFGAVSPRISLAFTALTLLTAHHGAEGCPRRHVASQDGGDIGGEEHPHRRPDQARLFCHCCYFLKI
jgi:hypothetical protein